MFIRDFLYTIKIMVRGRVSIFWTLVFPLLLATFMYMAFGNIYEQDEMFRNIKVAVVTEDESINGLNYMLDALSDGDDALLSVTRMSESDAEMSLADEEVEGIIYTDDVKLTVAESSVNASILETVLSEYKQYEHALKDIYKEGTEPKGGMVSDGIGLQQYMSGTSGVDDMSDLVEKLSEQRSYYTEKASTEGSQNVYNNYFYAIFAMSCLFASLSSIEMMSNLQANVSATGKRKKCVPTEKNDICFGRICCAAAYTFCGRGHKLYIHVLHRSGFWRQSMGDPAYSVCGLLYRSGNRSHSWGYIKAC